MRGNVIPHIVTKVALIGTFPGDDSVVDLADLGTQFVRFGRHLPENSADSYHITAQLRRNGKDLHILFHGVKPRIWAKVVETSFSISAVCPNTSHSLIALVLMTSTIDLVQSRIFITNVTIRHLVN